jgi:hypothetical protein
MWVKRNTYRLLLGKPEGKRPLGTPRRRWVDIRTDVGEVGWGDVDWIGLAQNRNRWRARYQDELADRQLVAMKLEIELASLHCKLQTHPLVRKAAPKEARHQDELADWRP